jgi:phosphatidate phosphatase APP1
MSEHDAALNAKRVDMRLHLGRQARRFAGWRRNVKRRLGLLAPLRIVLYGGYGRSGSVYVRGRVLEERSRRAPAPTDHRLVNFWRTFQQLESDEVPGVELVLRAGGSEASVTTDEEGYFQATLAPVPAAAPGWLAIEATATRAPYPTAYLPSAQGSALIPSPRARFGVISDIDDTILRTHVSNKAKMVYLTLLDNALTRASFERTAELYQGLARGGQGAPFFYVSHSMWNLFPLLEQFIAHQALPRGPLLLRDVGLFNEPRETPSKAAAIAELLDTYPDLGFVLIGDSGEHDLDVYLAAAHAQPGRIQAILIRNVSGAKRGEKLRAQAERDAAPGCSVLVFEDTALAIALCRDLGLWCAGEARLSAAPVAPGE